MTLITLITSVLLKRKVGWSLKYINDKINQNHLCYRCSFVRYRLSNSCTYTTVLIFCTLLPSVAKHGYIPTSLNVTMIY